MRLALAILLVVLIVLAFAGGDNVGVFVEWLKQIDTLWAAVLIGLLYTPASLVMFPGTLLTLTAALLPFWVALIAVSLGSTFAAAITFLVGRTLGRAWVEAKFAHSPRFRALDRAVGEQGFRIVLLTRLSPVFPFTVLNYSFSLTRVSFGDYVLATWLGMIPGTVLILVLGTTAKSLGLLFAELAAGRVADNLAQTALLVVGLLATVVVVVVVTRIARRALKPALEESEP